MKAQLIPSLSDITAAAKNIAEYAHITPVLSSEIINSILGAEVYFKCENFQKSGAFKFRGACNALLNLRHVPKNIPVTTHSSGNHAGALAKAAKTLHRKCIVVMPDNAPKVKVNAVKHYGAQIVFCKPTLQDRETTTEKVIEETAAILIHPYNNFDIIAGQGTASLELLTQVNNLNCIVAPVGGGGLLSGTAIAVKESTKNIKVYAGEPAGANDAYQSFKARKIVPQTNPKTIADGLLTSLGDRTFKAISTYVDDIFTVSEEEIKYAMLLIWQHMKIIIEPSSAVALAALLTNKEAFNKQRVGIILSGGNLDFANLPFI